PKAAAVGRRKAVCDREPEAGALARAAAVLERLEDPLGVLGGEAGPAVADTDQDLAFGGAHGELDRVRRRRQPERVLEHVHQHALDLGSVDAHRRRVVELDRDALGLRAETLQRTGDELVDAPELWGGERGAGFEAREVE